MGQIGQIIESCRAAGPAISRRTMFRFAIWSGWPSTRTTFTAIPACGPSCNSAFREQLEPAWVVSLPGEPFVYPLAAHHAFVQQVIDDAPLRFAYLANRALRA